MRTRFLVGTSLVLGAALIGVAWGARQSDAEELESVLGGEERYYRWHGHRVFYATRGQGPRLVLVHSIHAAANSFEWRNNVRALSEYFEVYALDLLGFGKSDRPPLPYTARLYIDLLTDFLRDVVGSGALVAASSLSAAHVIAAADGAPDLVAGLVLVGPTGVNYLIDAPGPLAKGVQGFFRSPVLGEAAFNALVSRAGIRYFLGKQGYAAPERVTPEIVDHYHRASHQPGARYAPAAFVGQHLNVDIRDAFARLRQPIALVWGRRATVIPPGEAEAFRRLNGAARVVEVDDASALAHEERPEVFNEVVVDVAEAAGLLLPRAR